MKCSSVRQIPATTKEAFFIIRLRHIPFSPSVKLRQLDRRASAESENDLITAAISMWIYGIHNACLTRYQRAPIRERAPVVLTELQSLVSSKMQLSKALMWGVGKQRCGWRTVLFFLAPSTGRTSTVMGEKMACQNVNKPTYCTHPSSITLAQLQQLAHRKKLPIELFWYWLIKSSSSFPKVKKKLFFVFFDSIWRVFGWKLFEDVMNKIDFWFYRFHKQCLNNGNITFGNK